MLYALDGHNMPFSYPFQTWSKKPIPNCNSKHNKLDTATKQECHRISALLNLALCPNIFPSLPLVGTQKPDYG